MAGHLSQLRRGPCRILFLSSSPARGASLGLGAWEAPFQLSLQHLICPLNTRASLGGPGRPTPAPRPWASTTVDFHAAAVLPESTAFQAFAGNRRVFEAVIHTYPYGAADRVVPCALLVGMWNGTAAVDNSMEVLQKN